MDRYRTPSAIQQNTIKWLSTNCLCNYFFFSKISITVPSCILWSDF